MKRLISLYTLIGCIGLAPAVSAYPGFGFSMGPDGMRLEFEQGFLGVVLSEVDAETVEELKLPAERGAAVKKVAPKTPAAEAGLAVNDVVITYNDTRVESAMQLQRMVRETPVGRKVQLVIIREGSEQKIALTVGSSRGFNWSGRFEIPPRDPDEDANQDMDHPSFPPFFDQRPRRDAPKGGTFPSLTPSAKPRLGVVIQPIGEQLAQFFGLKSGQSGVLVTRVAEGSVAASAGLQAGDVILKVNGKSVAVPEEVIDLVDSAPAGKNNILILRDKQEQEVEVLFEDEKEEEGIEDSI